MSPDPVSIQPHDPTFLQEPPHRGERGVHETAPDVYEITSEAQYLDFIQTHLESHCLVTVILPEVQPTRWWYPLVHNSFAWRLKWTLLFRPETVVTTVPYTIHD